MDGGTAHSAPPADAGHAAAHTDGPAPVQAETRHANNAQGQHSGPPSEKSSSPGRMTPRPTFLENLADSRDSQFMLNRRDSDDLDRYFVSLNNTWRRRQLC